MLLLWRTDAPRPGFLSLLVVASVVWDRSVRANRSSVSACIPPVNVIVLPVTNWLHCYMFALTVSCPFIRYTHLKLMQSKDAFAADPFCSVKIKPLPGLVWFSLAVNRTLGRINQLERDHLKRRASVCFQADWSASFLGFLIDVILTWLQKLNC